MTDPLISLILPTKNAMPHLRDTIQALQRQTHQNFELIIQDGKSTDGTLEYLESVKGLPMIHIESKQDFGIGDAYGRGMERSQGEYLCFLAADERLFKHSLELGMSWYKMFPHAAFIIGAVELLRKDQPEIFVPQPYDFLDVLSCKNVPPIAGIINRRVVGEDFYYDRSLKSCADYDFWLRLGVRFSDKELIVRPDIFMKSLATRSSMSYRVESIQQFCSDKCFILNRFIDLRPEFETYRYRGLEGICRWAASTACSLDPNSTFCTVFSMEAEQWSKKDNPPPSDYTTIDCYIPKQQSQRPGFPRFLDRFFFGLRHVKFLHAVRNWIGSKLHGRVLVGEENPWGYITYYSVNVFPQDWIKVSFQVQKGAIGICLMCGRKILFEKIFYQQTTSIETYFPLTNPNIDAIVFRNGGVGYSSLRIHALAIIRDK